jgi:hypothetical protein
VSKKKKREKLAKAQYAIYWDARGQGLSRKEAAVLAGFDPVPYVASSDTSRQAAEEIVPHVGNLREKVYECIAAHPTQWGSTGVTDEQIAEFTGLNPSTCRPRRLELLREGRIRQVGEGRTASGRRAALWGISA